MTELFSAAPLEWQMQWLTQLAGRGGSKEREAAEERVAELAGGEGKPPADKPVYVFPTTEALLILLLMSLVWAVGTAVYGVSQGWW